MDFCPNQISTYSALFYEDKGSVTAIGDVDGKTQTLYKEIFLEKGHDGLQGQGHEQIHVKAVDLTVETPKRQIKKICRLGRSF